MKKDRNGRERETGSGRCRERGVRNRAGGVGEGRKKIRFLPTIAADIKMQEISLKFVKNMN